MAKAQLEQGSVLATEILKSPPEISQDKTILSSPKYMSYNNKIISNEIWRWFVTKQKLAGTSTLQLCWEARPEHKK
jgi:hypothetical protein